MSGAAVRTGSEPASPAAIYATLRQEIVTLRLRPATQLSENELAARFGTSRAPIREALIRLVEDGLIAVRPQRGSFVTRISLQAMERARFVREALEVAIIQRATQGGLTEAAQDQAEAAIAGQIAAGSDAEAFTRHDDLFHRSFAEGAALVGVWAIIEREKAQFDRVRFLSLPGITPVETLIAQHRKILAAVQARDVAAAEQAIRTHMSEVLRITGHLSERYPELIEESP